MTANNSSAPSAKPAVQAAASELSLEAVRDELLRIEHVARASMAQSEAELEQALDELEAAEQELAVALEDLGVVRGNATTSTTTSETRSAV